MSLVWLAKENEVAKCNSDNNSLETRRPETEQQTAVFGWASVVVVRALWGSLDHLAAFPSKGIESAFLPDSPGHVPCDW